MSAVVTNIYRAVMLEIERRRQALGFPMEKFSEYAGLSDRYYPKLLHADEPSGRQANWGMLEIIMDALYPHGYDVIIKAKPGQVISAENLKAKLLGLAAQKDPKCRRELMRELSHKAAEGRKNIPKRRRKAIARQAARVRWRRYRNSRMRTAISTRAQR